MYRTQAGVVGFSKSIVDLIGRAQKMSCSNATVLIQGETGTGKELVAKFIHDQSGRTGAFISISLAAIPENLVEAELFGVEKGAYTSASNSRPGIFERAEGGTVFLDEIGDVPLKVQVKLLRVLQERRVSRIGSGQEVPIDVRIVAATNCNLVEAVKSGRFREDLYYRLRVLPLELPPLRERPDDIESLLNYFNSQSAMQHGKSLTFSQAALAALRAYSWPGNIRELKALIERLSFTSETGLIGLRDLPDAVKFATGSIKELTIATESQSNNLERMLAEYEQGLIQQALDLNNGSISAAASFLGVKRTTLHDKVKRFGLRLQGAE